MKTLTIIFLFLFTILTFGQPNFQQQLLDYSKKNTNLVKDLNIVTLFDEKTYNDFSNLKFTQFPVYQETISDNKEWFMGGYNTNKFYNLDFSADPFDGKIDVLVIGEPSTNVNITLALATIISLIFIQRRKNLTEQMSDC